VTAVESTTGSKRQKVERGEGRTEGGREEGGKERGRRRYTPLSLEIHFLVTSQVKTMKRRRASLEDEEKEEEEEEGGKEEEKEAG